MSELTILIPTYNRKERLLAVLDSLSVQGHYGEYELIVSDNHSDYDVLRAINEHCSSEFLQNFHFHRWGFNTGMGTNLSVPFTFVKTKWCWLLSDDDVLIDESLENILSDVARDSRDIVAYKYSAEGFEESENISIASIREYCDYFVGHKRGRIFMSMLYNMDAMNPYFTYLTNYSYTAISFLIPIFLSISKSNKMLQLSSNKLYCYHNNGDTWHSTPSKYLEILLGFRTFFDIDFGLNRTDSKMLKKLVFGNDFDNRLIANILKVGNKAMKKYYYNVLSPFMFSPLHKRIPLKILFYFVFYFDIQPDILIKIKRLI